MRPGNKKSQNTIILSVALAMTTASSICVFAKAGESFDERRSRMQQAVDQATNQQPTAPEPPRAPAIPVAPAAPVSPASADQGPTENPAPSAATTSDTSAMQQNPYQINVQKTVSISTIPVLKYLLTPSKNYRIDPQVAIDGYYYKFTVHTPHGDYDVVSIRKLMQLCREIDVLEDFHKKNVDNQVWEGVKNSAIVIGKGVGRILIKPGDSLRAIGVGTGKTLRWTVGLLKMPFAGKARLDADGNDRALGAKGPLGAERRRVAFELGIDVYTSNPTAYALIDEIAKKRSAGGLPIGLSIFALPGGSVFALSLTPIGHDQKTEEMIRDNSPDELLRSLRIYYHKQLQLDTSSASAVRTLLDNPNFSPREQAYLYRYLADMRDVAGHAEAVAFLAQTPSPQMASIVSGQVELLALLHRRARKLREFIPIRNTLGALAEDGTLCLVISNDIALYQDDIETSLDLITGAAAKIGANSAEVWTTGQIPKLTQEAARRRGVACYENILMDPVFRQIRAEEQTAPISLPSVIPPPVENR